MGKGKTISGCPVASHDTGGRILDLSELMYSAWRVYVTISP